MHNIALDSYKYCTSTLNNIMYKLYPLSGRGPCYVVCMNYNVFIFFYVCIMCQSCTVKIALFLWMDVSCGEQEIPDV